MFSYSSLSIGYLGHAMKCGHEIHHIELCLVLPTHIQQVLCRRTHAQTPIQLGIFRILTYSLSRFRKEGVGTTVKGLRYDLVCINWQHQSQSILTCFRVTNSRHALKPSNCFAILFRFSARILASKEVRVLTISKRASNQHEIHIRFHSLMGIRNPNLRLRHHVSSTKATSQPIARQWLWFKKMLTLVSTCRGFALMSLFAPCTWINSYAIIMFIENMWLSNYQTLAPLKSYGSKDLVHTDLIWINDFQVSSFIWPRLRTPSVWLWKSANIKKTHSNVSNQIISSIKPLTYKLCRSKVPTKLSIFNFFYLFDSSFKR